MNMFYRNRNNLFKQGDISSSLRVHVGKLEQEIKNMTLIEINSKEESEFIKELVERYKVKIPVLKDDKKEINPEEGEIEICNRSPFHDEPRTFKKRGLKISVRIPFEGDPQLFHYRATTYSLSGTPEGLTEGKSLVLYYETAEQDPEKIKNLWKTDLNSIQQNLGWLTKDIDEHNDSLENQLKTLVANRKKEADDNQSLIEQIKN